MKDRKSVKLLVIALMLAFMLFLPAVLAETDDSGTYTDQGTATIQGDEVLPYYIHLAEDGGIHYKITSDRPIDVYLMDSENYEAFTSGNDYYYDHRQVDVTYAEYTINEPAGDYYILIQSNGTYTSTVDYYVEFGPDVGGLGDLFNGDGGMFGLLAGSMCIVWIVLLIIEILIIRWVYKDAKRRGKSGGLWALIVLFTGLLGIIIWLLVRPPIQPPMGYGAYPPQQQYYQQQPPPQQYYQQPPPPQQQYYPPQDDPYRRP